MLFKKNLVFFCYTYTLPPSSCNCLFSLSSILGSQTVETLTLDMFRRSLCVGNKIFFEDETDKVSGGPLTGKIKVRSKSFLFYLFFF